MATGPIRAAPGATDFVLAPDLEGQSQPIVVIDIDAAAMLAANAAARAAFGIFPYASFPFALDPQTPALEQMRALITPDGQDNLGLHTLIFRGNGARLSLNCEVSRYGNTRPSEYMVRVIADAPDGVARSADGHEPPAVASTEPVERLNVTQPLSVQQRSEEETLREIARQIRDAARVVDPNASATADETGLSSEGTEDNLVIQQNDADPSAEAVPTSSPVDLAATTTVRVLDPDHLAKLAHELKTPLTAIAAAAEVMRDERLGQMGNARYLGYAADIHESATHALDVITSLLADSKKPEGAASRLVTLDLNALVARTVSSLQALADTRGLTLAFEAEDSNPQVIANPTALRQILLNLLTNAIKFTPRKGDVRAVTGYLNDGRVFLVVRDTGCGIGAASNSDSHAEGDGDAQLGKHGHGIGLPLVQRLVRDMGADIEIGSAPGKGTVVLIAFGGFARWSA